MGDRVETTVSYETIGQRIPSLQQVCYKCHEKTKKKQWGVERVQWCDQAVRIAHPVVE